MLEAVHKRRPQSGREGICPVRTFFGQEEGVLQMRWSTLFGAKNTGFFEIYGMFARTRGLIQCGHLADIREKGGQFFAILCGRRLWTALYAFAPSAPTFHFNLRSFCWWGRKNIFVSGRRYPCYATDHAMSAIITSIITS